MDIKLDFSKFYIFGEKYFDGPVAVAPENNKDIPTDVRKKFCCGDFSVIKPEHFVHVRGNKLYDMVVAGAPSFYLMSQRLIDVLEKNNVTGWGSYPVTITSSSLGEISNYHAFYIFGKADKADRSLSEKIEVVFPNKSKGFRDKGYYFPLDSWDGSDFFYHIGTVGSITVTEKVKNLFESINATNVQFVRCTEYVWA